MEAATAAKTDNTKMLGSDELPYRNTTAIMTDGRITDITRRATIAFSFLSLWGIMLKNPEKNFMPKELGVEDWGDVLTRREVLLRTVVATTFAIGLQPILGLARAPESALRQTAGKRIITEIENVELWKDPEATIVYTKVKVYANRQQSLTSYTLRDVVATAIPPTIVIARASDKTEVLALGGDDEVVYISDTSNLDDEIYIDKAIAEAQNKNMRKTARYLTIIKEKYNKYKKSKSS